MECIKSSTISHSKISFSHFVDVIFLRVPIARRGLLTAARACERKINVSDCTSRVYEEDHRGWRRKSVGPLPWIDCVRDVRTLANSTEIYKVSNSDCGDCDWFLDEFKAHLCLTKIWKEKEKRVFINVLETFNIQMRIMNMIDRTNVLNNWLIKK